VARAQIAQLVGLAFSVYYLLLFGRVILSWVRLPPYHPVHRRLGPFLYAVTEPLLRPIRRVLHRYQSGYGIDFSPVVAYVLLEVAHRVILRLLGYY